MASKANITADRARQLLIYDPKTGILEWKFRAPNSFVATEYRSAAWLCNHWNATWAGKIAGGLRNGYLRIRIDGKKYTASHIAWLILKGRMPKKQIDHRDGIRTRNAEDNLRAATNAQNAQNRKKRKTNRSGLTGVWQHKSKWQSEICVEGRRIYLGLFRSREEARSAYLSAKEIHHRFQPVPRSEA